MPRDHTSFLLHADFDEQVARSPDAVALETMSASITYSALKQRADTVAAGLRQRGIAEGCYVGLHIERSIEYVICLLAILKVNAAVVPLPPTYPRSRLLDILEYSALNVVIDDDASPLSGIQNTSVVRFSELANSAAGGDSDSTPGNPEQPAFVLCSSGSTGKPKMIERSHRSFYHRLTWTWRVHPYSAGERCCQKSNMTTTHAIYELFEPLLRGIPVVIVPDDEARNLGRFWDLIGARSITRLLMVPSALQVSLDLPGFTASSIRVLVLMGEYVHHKLAGRAIESFPLQTHLYSIYGSTEASSTLVCDLRESYQPGRELPLGRPISPEIDIHVLTPDLRPVSAGEAGVLHISGPALFSGYFRDPDLTSSVLLKVPAANEVVYDTHDQVRLLSDGNLEYVGRTDHTVKVRGFRVDLQEVERALLLHPAVRQAAIVLREGDAANAALIGFFAPAEADVADLFRSLREYLPAYMVPSVLVGLEEMPLTASSKIDRQALLQAYSATASSDPQSIGHSDTEIAVSRSWGELLHAQRIRPDSSFFEIGGTSLTAFAAVHRLRVAFGLDDSQLSDQSIYQFPTVRTIAAFIDGLKDGTAQSLATGTTCLVRLRKGSDNALPPLFLIASAGGTLGAYEKLVKSLVTERDIYGVRDPYIWGERDPESGFRGWVSLYVDAIRHRQPAGPYHIVAYSSAGAFGYEVARSLREQGQDVAVLALIDPFGLDRPTADSFGYRVMQARFRGRLFKLAVKLAGSLRALVPSVARIFEPTPSDDVASPTSAEIARRIDESKRSLQDVISFSTLLELNAGLPFGITEAELRPLDPGQYFAAFVEKARVAAPDLNPERLVRIFDQYYGLQVPAQQNYRLRKYDGDVLLIEMDGPNSGLLAAQFRPHIRRLRTRRLKLGAPTEKVRNLARALPPGLRDHYLSMRDEVFVRDLAVELSAVFR